MRGSPLEQKQLIQLHSEKYVSLTMPRVLKMRDMLSTFVIILLFLANVPNAIAGGAASLTFWLAGALLFFVPTVIVTAQLGVLFPYEGSIYNWTYKAFGPFLGFFTSVLFWIPGPLLILASADLIISYIQGLNAHWLVASWQQGLVLILILLGSALVGSQRSRTVQGIINATVWVCLLAVFLIFVAGVVWLLKGHQSATSFRHMSDWAISWSPWYNPFSTSGNFGLFGLITLGYLGANLPLNMAGEMSPERKVITQHLLVGAAIVVVGYLLATWGVLVIVGAHGANNLFVMVTAVNQSLGSIFGSITAICILATIFVATIAYNCSYSRILMVASIDQRLPVAAGRLNRNRVPSRALWFQTCVAIVLAAVFFLIVPMFLDPNVTTTLVSQVYFTGVAAATVLWAFSSLFLFCNLLRFIQAHRDLVNRGKLFAIPVLVFVSLIGIVTGIVAIIDTMMNSWTPLISDSSWFLIIIGVVLTFLILACVASMVSTSESLFEQMNEAE
jgi:amino acid transporter